MKNILLLFCLYISGICAGQDYFSGKMMDARGAKKEIFYDRTLNDISFSIFQTVYKVTDAAKRPIFTITLSHDRTKGIVLLSIKPQNSTPYGRALSYDKTYCGLIFNDHNTLDTAFNINDDYEQLLSFTDTGRTYPILHKLNTKNNIGLILDPLSKLRIRQHNKIVDALPYLDDEASFNSELTAMRNALYIRKTLLHDSVDAIHSLIDDNVAQYMKDRKVEKDKKRYEGAKRFGAAYGAGMLAVNENIYDGEFKDGKFASGNVFLKNDRYEYCGQFKNDTFNGLGWIKYANGSYLLGHFANGTLVDGIALQKEKDGEIYFGGYTGTRQGFGEFQNAAGGKYTGQFAFGRLVKGYAKEIDPFGYYTYSTFDAGTKTAIDPKTAEEFFGLSLTEGK